MSCSQSDNIAEAYRVFLLSCYPSYNIAEAYPIL